MLDKTQYRIAELSEGSPTIAPDYCFEAVFRPWCRKQDPKPSQAVLLT